MSSHGLELGNRIGVAAAVPQRRTAVSLNRLSLFRVLNRPIIG